MYNSGIIVTFRAQNAVVRVGYCIYHALPKISLLFSMTNCTALFFACMSVISRSRLVSRIIVGANTTARFLGVICQMLVRDLRERCGGTTYQVLAFPNCHTRKMEDEEFETIPMLGWEHVEGLSEMSTSFLIVIDS